MPPRVAVGEPEQHCLMMSLATHMHHHLPNKQAEQHRLTLVSSACLGHHPAVKQADQ